MSAASDCASCGGTGWRHCCSSFEDHERFWRACQCICIGIRSAPSAWVSEPLSTVPFDETGARERAAEHAFSKGDLDT